MLAASPSGYAHDRHRWCLSNEFCDREPHVTIANEMDIILEGKTVLVDRPRGLRSDRERVRKTRAQRVTPRQPIAGRFSGSPLASRRTGQGDREVDRPYRVENRHPNEKNRTRGLTTPNA